MKPRIPAQVIQDHIKSEITANLFGNYIVTLLFTLCVVLVSYYELTYAEGNIRYFLNVWLVTILLILCYRFIISIVYHYSRRHHLLNTKKTKMMYNLFFIGAALTAACFGLLGSLLMPDDMLHRAFNLIIISGVVAGSVQSLSASYIINITYVLLAFIPLLTWELIRISQGVRILISVFILMFLYCFFSIAIAWRNYKMQISNIKLKYENEIMSKMLEDHATHDMLTGLFNRFYLHDHLNLEMSRAKRNQSHFSIIMLDVNSFKNYNDTYGHEIGDQVLHSLSQFLTKNIRTGDVICRFGGDEFIIVLQGATSEEALERARELHNSARTLAIPLANGNKEYIGFSMGIATYPEDGNTVATLIKAADHAMYQAKRSDGIQIATYSPHKSW